MTGFEKWRTRILGGVASFDGCNEQDLVIVEGE